MHGVAGLRPVMLCDGSMWWCEYALFGTMFVGYAADACLIVCAICVL